MTILITGSQGKTASALTKLLVQNKQSFLIASRNPSPTSSLLTVKFDWLDSSTWSNPFSQSESIRAIYLVSPDIQAARDQIVPFVKYARERGVKRFVLLSAWEVPENGPLLGKAHAGLRTMGVEWCVLRPHFFMENFTEPYHLPCIKNESKIYSACGDGRKPYISARDIAAVAYRALIDEQSHNTDYVITGSESLTYDEIAKTFSNVLGRKIEHVKLSKDDLAKKMIDEFGYDAEMAEYLAELDVRCSKCEGAEPTNNVLKVTGREPWKLTDILEESKEIWL